MAGAPTARRRILVIGGGAAGFFGAVACAEADPAAEVSLHEATAHLLAKVRVSGAAAATSPMTARMPGRWRRATRAAPAS